MLLFDVIPHSTLSHLEAFEIAKKNILMLGAPNIAGSPENYHLRQKHKPELSQLAEVHGIQYFGEIQFTKRL